MKTDLQVAMSSGVFVEFLDAAGHTVGRAVIADWRDRPVPERGDRFTAPVRAGGVVRKLSGIVRTRNFDVQTDLDGDTSVWVCLTVTVRPPRKKKSAGVRGDFSAN